MSKIAKGEESWEAGLKVGGAGQLVKGSGGRHDGAEVHWLARC